ncbi:MAG: chloride channel protein [Bacteroidales bacterium]
MKKRISKIKEWILSLQERQRLIILSVAVGLFCGISAVLLKFSIDGVKWMLTSWFNTDKDSLFYLIYPGIGMLLAMFVVKFFAKEPISHGITRILYSISRKQSNIHPSTIWTPLVSSAFTIGFGGSVGAEAPIVHSGAAIGSVIGSKLNLSYKHITLLVACGAAGSLAGIFKAPLAGIVFTIEILMFDLTLSSIVPLLISSVTAITIPYIFLGQTVAFSSSTTPFIINNIPYYILLGVMCGFMSIYFIRTTMKVESLVSQIENPAKRWIISALSLGVLIYLFPPLYGEGYSSLSAALNNDIDVMFGNTIYGNLVTKEWFLLLFLFGVMMLKVFSMALTNAGGGVGGTFGPTLVIGGINGFLVARLINLTGLINLHEPNFALVGMGGLMAGVMHAPLTAIFLIAEITGGYDLLMPLMITSAVSYILTNSFEPNSIYAKRLALQGDLLTHNKDQAVLTLLNTEDLIEEDFISVQDTETLGQFTNAIRESHRNLFPVVDQNKKLLGVVTLDDVRDVMFDISKYDTLIIKDLMHKLSYVVYKDESMEQVMETFNKSDAWNLPVVDRENNYLGFISRSKLFDAYREQLIDFSQ